MKWISAKSREVWVLVGIEPKYVKKLSAGVSEGVTVTVT